eukprot:4801683-Alexandrium_andersonii.AAC.1
MEQSRRVGALRALTGPVTLPPRAPYSPALPRRRGAPGSAQMGKSRWVGVLRARVAPPAALTGPVTPLPCAPYCEDRARGGSGIGEPGGLAWALA